MFRALFWKEWRQLALIRWGGVALGAILPTAFMAGAELSQRGLLPTAKISGYAARDLMYELLPAALAFGLWPLLGLLSVVQALTGDRVAGTESFLLERPVPRATVWRARLVSSLATLVVAIAGTAAIAAAAAALAGPPPSVGWTRWLMLLSGGLALAAVAYIGGTIGASLVASPLAALLLGVILGAFPLLLGAELSGAFLYAKIAGGVFLGIIAPVILLPAFVVASWLAFCRGEPAGRGRIKRSFALLGGALGGALLLFLMLAPVAVRANAGVGQHAVVASPSGGGAFVGSFPNMGGSGWLVDVATGARRAFLPPPVSEVTWRPDGSQFAVLSWSSPLGGLAANPRIEIRSGGTGALLRSIPFADDTMAFALAWARDGLVAIVGTSGSRTQAVEVIDPATGERRDTGFRSQSGAMGLTGPVDDGRVFIRRVGPAKYGESRTAPRGFHLLPVDVATARVGPPRADLSGGEILFVGWPTSLSRSGRYARVIDRDEDSETAHVVDLRPNAAPLDRVATPGARWIAGDRLLWVETLGDRKRLFVAPPGGRPTALREWRAASVGIDPSPDGRSVFISVLPQGEEPPQARPDPMHFTDEAPAGAVPEELIYRPDEGGMLSLGKPFSDRPGDQRYTQWAGNKTLARMGLGFVYLEDIDGPEKRRYVIGGPG